MGERRPKTLRISIEICEPETIRLYISPQHRNGRVIPVVPLFFCFIFSMNIKRNQNRPDFGSQGGGQASLGNYRITEVLP